MTILPRPSHLPSVAYFSMEIGLDPAMPTYSGGLGVLAGDTLRAAADLGLPMVGVTLLYRKGSFRQRLDGHGNQTEEPASWMPEDHAEPLPPRVTVAIEGRPVRVRAWRYMVRGVRGQGLPVYLLDTNLPENDSWDRGITDQLYGGDERYRLCQEVVLGMGGVALVRALGYQSLDCYHMNEGHSAFLAVALLQERSADHPDRAPLEADVEAVRSRCVFTTHTPVAAGHDMFPGDLVRQVLGDQRVGDLQRLGCWSNGTLNMTHLALQFSRYVNGVSLPHRGTTHAMFPSSPVESVTNGVHAVTWTSAPFRRLYDRYIPEWRRDNLYLRQAGTVPLREVQGAHREAKEQLLAEVERRCGVKLDPAALTVGFARRATPYKRATLLFSDPERLQGIVGGAGPLQVIYGGKAHPRDEGGKALIRQVFHAAEMLRGTVPVVYLEEYEMGIARHLTAGVDLWLNTPQKPQEASGTSGMKAALNGVPSLSVLDGWWVEGHIEGVTGWAIEDSAGEDGRWQREDVSLYDKLERVIAPMYYQKPEAFAHVMRSAIALNGSYFNAQRMVAQYLENAYRAAWWE